MIDEFEWVVVIIDGISLESESRRSFSLVSFMVLDLKRELFDSDLLLFKGKG